MLYRKVIDVCLDILRKLFSLLKQVVFRIRYLGVRGLGLRSRYMATGWTVWGIESWWRRDFQHPSRPSLSPTEPLTQWVPRIKQPGRGVDHPPHLAPMINKEQSCPASPPLGLHGLF